MFAKAFICVGAVIAASGAFAQTQSSTNCYRVGNTVQCNTNTTAPPPAAPGVDWGAFNRQQQEINQRNQQNIDRSMENLGAAMRADRERRQMRRAEKELAEAIARDPDPAPGAPPSESPVQLACSANTNSVSVTLYPNSGRADVTSGGVSKMRAATFTEHAVTWQSPVWRTSISRLDLTFVSVALLPALKGMQLTGSCALAQRKF